MQRFSAAVLDKKKEEANNHKHKDPKTDTTWDLHGRIHPTSSEPIPRREHTLLHASRYLFLQLADYESTLFLGIWFDLSHIVLGTHARTQTRTSTLLTWLRRLLVCKAGRQAGVHCVQGKRRALM